MANLKSARSVQTITAVGYHRCDPGLYLQVAKSGTKSWLFRFKSPVTSKQREMGLGSLDITSLSQARNLTIEYRQQLPPDAIVQACFPCNYYYRLLARHFYNRVQYGKKKLTVCIS